MSGYLSYRGYCRGGSDKGFTLVELMITIAILAIIAFIAVPTFSGFVNRSKVNTVPEVIKRDIVTAKNKAFSKKTIVTLSTLAGSTDWSNGYHAWIDYNGDGLLNQQDEEITYKDSLATGVTAIDSLGVTVTTFQFNKDRRLIGDRSIVFSVCSVTPNASGGVGKQITLLPTGSISVTNNSYMVRC